MVAVPMERRLSRVGWPYAPSRAPAWVKTGGSGILTEGRMERLNGSCECASPLPSPSGEGGTASAVSDEVLPCLLPLLRHGAREACALRRHLARQGTFSLGRRGYQLPAPSPRACPVPGIPFLGLFPARRPDGVYRLASLVAQGRRPSREAPTPSTLRAGKLSAHFN